MECLWKLQEGAAPWNLLHMRGVLGKATHGEMPCRWHHAEKLLNSAGVGVGFVD